MWARALDDPLGIGKMFIRQNSYTRKDGTSRSSCSLREHRLVDGEAKQITLLNLGQDFAVPRPEWPVLIARIKDAFRGQGQLTLEDESESVRKAAREIVRRLRAKGYQADVVTDQYAGMHVDDIVFPVHAVRSVGGERVALRALETLQVEGVLQDLGMPSRDVRLSSALLVACMLRVPEVAEPATWLQYHSSILELLDIEADRISAKHLIRLTERLYVLRHRLLAGLAARESGFAEAQMGPVYCSFKRLPSVGTLDKAAGGETRATAVEGYQTIMYCFDGEGLMRCCDLVNWRHGRPRSLQKALRRLKLESAILVLNPGEVSEGVLRWLSQHQIKWIAVSRRSQPPSRAATVLESSKAKGNLWKLFSHTSELRLYAADNTTGQPDDSAYSKRAHAFECKLDSLHEGLSIPNRLKAFDVVQNRIGRLEAKYADLSWQYDIHLTLGKGGNASSVTYVRIPGTDPLDLASNRCVLRTNQVDWSLEEVLQAFARIVDSRNTFDSINVRAQIDANVPLIAPRNRSQLFLSILACHVATYILQYLRRHNQYLTWNELLQKLEGWKRITTLLHSKGRQVIANRQDSQLNSRQESIAQAMGISPGYNRSRVVEKWS